MRRVASLAVGSAVAVAVMTFGAGNAVAATPDSVVPVASVSVTASPKDASPKDGSGDGGDGSTAGTGFSRSSCPLPSPLDRLCPGAAASGTGPAASFGGASSATGDGTASSGASSGAAGVSSGTAATAPSGTAGTTATAGPTGSMPGGGLISAIMLYIAGCLQSLGL
jgi:type IV secretion system protein TrbL